MWQMGILRRTATILLLLYWGALFIGTHLPTNLVRSLSLSDKLVHVGAFAGLAFLLAAAIGGRRPTWKNLILAGLIASIYGAVDEISQIPIPTRHGELLDWLADTLGVLFGLAVYRRIVVALQPFEKRWFSRNPDHFVPSRESSA